MPPCNDADVLLYSINQKLVLPRYAYFAVAGALQRYSLRGGSTDVHFTLPSASAAGEALTVHHMVRLSHVFPALRHLL